MKHDDRNTVRFLAEQIARMIVHVDMSDGDAPRIIEEHLESILEIAGFSPSLNDNIANCLAELRRKSGENRIDAACVENLGEILENIRREIDGADPAAQPSSTRIGMDAESPAVAQITSQSTSGDAFEFESTLDLLNGVIPNLRIHNEYLIGVVGYLLRRIAALSSVDSRARRIAARAEKTSLDIFSFKSDFKSGIDRLKNDIRILGDYRNTGYIDEKDYPLSMETDEGIEALRAEESWTPFLSPEQNATSENQPKDGPRNEGDGFKINAYNPEMLEFISEAGEQLEAAGESLKALRENPAASPHLDRVRRRFRAIKGVAGFLNLRDLLMISRAAELLAEKAFNGEITLAAEHIDAMADAAELLKLMIDRMFRASNNIPYKTPSAYNYVMRRLHYLEAMSLIDRDARRADTGEQKQQDFSAPYAALTVSREETTIRLKALGSNNEECVLRTFNGDVGITRVTTISNQPKMYEIQKINKNEKTKRNTKKTSAADRQSDIGSAAKSDLDSEEFNDF